MLPKTPNSKSYYVNKALWVFILVIVIDIVWRLWDKHRDKLKDSTPPPMCSKHTCSAIDPVSEPAYNMAQVIKQSVLLEEHLVMKNKRCADCISKHFAHITGLCEEAYWLAGKKTSTYPYLAESVTLYSEWMDEWLKKKQNMTEDDFLGLSEKIREHRKKLVAAYF